jgi:hypothetical protein
MSVEHRLGPEVLAALVVTTKVLLLVFVIRVAIDPTWANLDGKAPTARAVMYPLGALAVPVWWMTRRRGHPFPWLADLLVTLTCWADLLGNRLDLYNSLESFDDLMHVLNTALVSAAVVLLTLTRTASLTAIVTMALASGLTASLGWELFEYATFLTRSTEWTTAYTDTVGDLALGWVGAVLAAAVVVTAWQRARTA